MTKKTFCNLMALGWIGVAFVVSYLTQDISILRAGIVVSSVYSVGAIILSELDKGEKL